MMALAEQQAERDSTSGSTGGSRERRCIVTGEVLPEARLLRFVLARQGDWSERFFGSLLF